MPGPKADFLLECNDQNVPEEDFRLAFCVRCRNPECQRSVLNADRFSGRVQNWQDRLFLKVPRLDPADPRAQEIHAQKFITLGEPEPPVEVPATPPSPHFPEEEAATRPDTPGARGVLALSNTPYRGPITLPGGPVSPQTPTRDPWAPEEKSTSQIVKPGATIRLGVEKSRKDEPPT